MAKGDPKTKITFNNFYKTKICPWFKKGACRWGDQCNYAHSETERRGAVDLTKTTLCPNALTHESHCGDINCRYAHTHQELRATTDVYKTSMCSFFSKDLPCPMGEKCRYAHGIHELRQKPFLECSVFSTKQNSWPLKVDEECNTKTNDSLCKTSNIPPSTRIKNIPSVAQVVLPTDWSNSPSYRGLLCNKDSYSNGSINPKYPNLDTSLSMAASNEITSRTSVYSLPDIFSHNNDTLMDVKSEYPRNKQLYFLPNSELLRDSSNKSHLDNEIRNNYNIEEPLNSFINTNSQYIDKNTFDSDYCTSNKNQTTFSSPFIQSTSPTTLSPNHNIFQVPKINSGFLNEEPISSELRLPSFNSYSDKFLNQSTQPSLLLSSPETINNGQSSYNSFGLDSNNSGYKSTLLSYFDKYQDHFKFSCLDGYQFSTNQFGIPTESLSLCKSNSAHSNVFTNCSENNNHPYYIIKSQIEGNEAYKIPTESNRIASNIQKFYTSCISNDPNEFPVNNQILPDLGFTSSKSAHLYNKDSNMKLTEALSLSLDSIILCPGENDKSETSFDSQNNLSSLENTSTTITTSSDQESQLTTQTQNGLPHTISEFLPLEDQQSSLWTNSTYNNSCNQLIFGKSGSEQSFDALLNNSNRCNSSLFPTFGEHMLCSKLVDSNDSPLESNYLIKDTSLYSSNFETCKREKNNPMLHYITDHARLDNPNSSLNDIELSSDIRQCLKSISYLITPENTKEAEDTQIKQRRNLSSNQFQFVTDYEELKENELELKFDQLNSERHVMKEEIERLREVVKKLIGI